MHALILQLNDVVEKVWLCLVIKLFRPITLRRLNILTLIDTSNCHGGLEVTHQTAMREVPGSISGSAKVFNVLIFCFVVVFF